MPREPVYRPPPDEMPPGQYPPGQLPPPGQYPQGQMPGQPPGGQRSSICVQLERRLVAETQGGNQGRDLLPRIENDMRQLERNYQVAQQQLNRADCWDQFLFSRTLKRKPICIQLAGEVDASRQRLADLEAQRRQIMGTGNRSFQDDIIRELARNGCGQQYVTEMRRREARNPFSSLWGEESDGPRGNPNQFGNLPFATYRTLCVRLCDGYYFPVSFSTLPNHFQRDADQCQSQCAALLPPKPRRGRRADGFSKQPAALYEPEIGVALPQGVRAGLLVQGGRIPAAGGRRQEGRSTSGAGWAERDRATQHEVVA